MPELLGGEGPSFAGTGQEQTRRMTALPGIGKTAANGAVAKQPRSVIPKLPAQRRQTVSQRSASEKPGHAGIGRCPEELS